MKQKLKWAGLGAALILAACGAKFWPAQWSAQYAVQDSQVATSQSVSRELADGSIRVAYRRDDDTLVVDTYDTTGLALQQDEFQLPFPSHFQFGAAPLFLDDNQLVWFGRNDRDSVLIDVAAQTVASLHEVLALDLPLDISFEIADAVVLDNGQLVLVGGDRRSPTSPFRQARVAVMHPGGSVESSVLAVGTSFSNVVARSGSDQYFVQYFEFDTTVPATVAFTFLGEGSVLMEQPQIDRGSLLQADLAGAWASGVFAAGLLHYNADLLLDWQDLSILVRKLVPTSDQHYLMLQLIDEQMAVVKRDAQAAVVWQRPASADATIFGGLAERDGRILYSESFSSRVKSVRTLPDDPAEGLPITTVAEKVRHRILDANGKELHRFKEPDYKAVLPRDPLTDLEGDALEYTAGSCQHFQGMLLAGGQFASVSRWCGDNGLDNQQESVFYFK